MSPRATIAAGVSRSIAAPAKRIVPERARTTPEIARLSVDLPTPFEPSTATISPRVDFQVDATEHVAVAIAGERPCTSSSGSACGMAGSDLRRRAVTEIGFDHRRIGRDFGRACLRR